MSARILFSVCCDRMSSACTSGRPELIIVANWRVKITTSRVLTPALSRSARPPPLALDSRTCTTTMRFLRRWAMTSSRLARSTLSLTSSPLRLRAVYSKTGIAQLPLAAHSNFGTALRSRLCWRWNFLVVRRRLANGPQEVVRLGRHAQTLVLGHFTAHVQLVERVVQRLHAVLLSRLHRRLDLVHLVVADQGADRGRTDHDFRGHDAAASLRLLEQRLRQHPFEHERELRAHLRLLVRREDVDDTVDRFRGGVGVQRGERQVARLRDRQRCLDRLEVAHFADEHDVGVLPQRILQRGLEAEGVRTHFALVDDARLVAMDELDGVFYRDDVTLELFVHLVDHRGQRRALARAGWAGDEDQSPRAVGQLGDDLG